MNVLQGQASHLRERGSKGIRLASRHTVATFNEIANVIRVAGEA